MTRPFFGFSGDAFPRMCDAHKSDGMKNMLATARARTDTSRVENGESSAKRQKVIIATSAVAEPLTCFGLTLSNLTTMVMTEAFKYSEQFITVMQTLGISTNTKEFDFETVLITLQQRMSGCPVSVPPRSHTGLKDEVDIDHSFVNCILQVQKETRLSVRFLSVCGTKPADVVTWDGYETDPTKVKLVETLSNNMGLVFGCTVFEIGRYLCMPTCDIKTACRLVQSAVKEVREHLARPDIATRHVPKMSTMGCGTLFADVDKTDTKRGTNEAHPHVVSALVVVYAILRVMTAVCSEKDIEFLAEENIALQIVAGILLTAVKARHSDEIDSVVRAIPALERICRNGAEPREYIRRQTMVLMHAAWPLRRKREDLSVIAVQTVEPTPWDTTAFKELSVASALLMHASRTALKMAHFEKHRLDLSPCVDARNMLGSFRVLSKYFPIHSVDIAAVFTDTLGVAFERLVSVDAPSDRLLVELLRLVPGHSCEGTDLLIPKHLKDTTVSFVGILARSIGNACNVKQASRNKVPHYLFTHTVRMSILGN